MENARQRENNRRAIPFIRIDSPSSNHRQSYISISSSEESIPVDAPLVRQPRCSVDIDMIPSEVSEIIRENGIDKQSSSYLDNLELRESIQDIA